MVTEAMIRRNARARLVRDGTVVYESTVGSLRRFKDDVREVATGYECGIGIEGYQDVKEGDIIQAFEIQEVPEVDRRGHHVHRSGASSSCSSRRAVP